jgi:hypothetical protein
LQKQDIDLLKKVVRLQVMKLQYYRSKNFAAQTGIEYYAGNSDNTFIPCHGQTYRRTLQSAM